MTVFYLIIPAAFVFFYGSKNVKATCEFRDSQVRWTDKCPLPVLAVSFIFGLWAVSMLLAGLCGWLIPFFGSILSGMTGALVSLVAALLYLYVVWGTYKLRINAWWCSLLLTIVWALSVVITFSRVSISDFYEKMKLPEQQLEMMRNYVIPQSPIMPLFFGIPFLGLLGYLLYTKRYFVNFPEQEKVT